MTVAYSTGDTLVINKSFIDNYLKDITKAQLGFMTPTGLIQTIATLGYLGCDPATVVASGITPSGGGSISFIRMLPEDSANPVYNSGNGVAVFFPNDALLNRAFTNNTLGNLGGGLFDNASQTGYFSAQPDGSTGFSSFGLVDPIITTDTGSGSFDTVFDEFGVAIQAMLESSAGDEMVVSTTLGESVCQTRHNPRLILPFSFDSFTDVRLFIGLGEPTVTVGDFLGASAPSLGQLGLRYEDGTDTTFQFVHQDGGGTLTSVDSTITPAVDTMYLLEVDVAAAGAADASVLLILRDSSGSILASTLATTSLPAATDNLFMFAGFVNITDGQPAMNIYWGSLALRP